MSDQKTATTELLLPLTDEQRHQARQKAREMVAREFGAAPQWKDYQRRSVSAYPWWLAVLVSVLMLIVLGAAANITVYRLFTAGRDHYLQTMTTYRESERENDNTTPLAPDFISTADPDLNRQADSVGVSVFLLAEFTVIVSVAARRVYFHDGGGRWLLVPIVAGLAMAFVGNWVITKPDDAWGLLETFVPPVAVLFMSLIGEQLIMQAIQQRHARQQLYERALTEWEHHVANVEQHPLWRARWATALREALQEVNAQGRGRSERIEVMKALTRADWTRLVWREMQADEWFDEAAIVDPTDPAPAGEKTKRIPAGSNGHGS